MANTPQQAVENRSDYLHSWYVSRKDLYKERHLQKTYGLSVQDLINLMEDQDFLCAICKKDFNELKPKNIHIDHCHNSNKIRGILCNNCNMALGLFKDDVEVLKEAIKYLENIDG